MGQQHKQQSPPEQQPPLPGLSGHDVRLIRQARGLRMADVAQRAKLSMTRLSFLENGKVPMTPGDEVRLLRALWPA